MIPFRLFLLVVGGLGIIIGTDSYSYSYPATSGYGYSLYQSPQVSYPGYQQPGLDYGNKGYGSTYSASCGTMKVIEVLDRILCEHSNKSRYSTTIYQIIKTLIQQLGWISDMTFIEPVYINLQAAITTLQSLQDSTYSTYGDSSLLSNYNDDEGSQQSQSQSSGTSGTGSKATSKTQRISNFVNKLNEKSMRGNVQARSDSFKEFSIKRGGMMSRSDLDSKTAAVAAQAQKITTLNFEVEDVESEQQQIIVINANEHEQEHEHEHEHQHQHQHQQQTHASSHSQQQVHSKPNAVKQQEKVFIEVDIEDDEVEQVIVESEQPALPSKFSSHNVNTHTHHSSHSLSDTKRSRRAGAYNDYTCALLPAVYCSEDKYDELLYNIIEIMITAAELLWQAELISFEVIDATDCTSEFGEDEIIWASYVAGGIDTVLYTLAEKINYLIGIYEILELEDDDDDNSYRAKGVSIPVSSPNAMRIMPMPQNPIMTLMNPQLAQVSQAYQSVGYVGQTPLTYPLQQQYRIGREVSPNYAATPTIFLVG
ncbi:hypothetical protein Ocin01_08319 [Orchesella cincta]|uniref:Uncharacterized protein n=1 Tax=Orchesella cincta TaxID=48709 RepID=A0A1D2MZI5_ORCCI|nr:hypothetical protein Ocin01_08319 [Orchesella cincta]